MMSSVILHIIAAVMWAIALFIMGGVGDQNAQDNKVAAKLGLAIAATMATAAFTLQVIA